MGKLIDPEKKARAKEKRAERKRRILTAARSTFSKMPFVEVTLDTIGQAAAVDRGVASMYFRTKEEIFLRLLREELGNWYAALEKKLDRSDDRVAPADLSELLAKSLAARPVLRRLLSLEAVVLEQNLDAMEVFRFQSWRRENMAAIGSLFEQQVDGLGKGEGIRLLHLAQLLTMTLHPASDPRGAATYDIGDPDFAVFEVDFESELKRVVFAMLNEGIEDQV
jgi:AcrR family transcriptional regulator